MYINALKKYIELKCNLRLSLDELKDKQWKRFKYLVNYAYENVPAYNKLYKKAGFHPGDLAGPQDLGSIPRIRKEFFQQNDLAELLAQGFTTQKLVSKRTSGSSGYPLIIYYTPQDRIYRTLLHLRILFANGMGFRDRMVQISDKRHAPNYSYFFQKLGFLPKDFLYCVEPSVKLLEDLKQINPSVIYTYTSSFILLADEIINRRESPVQPKLIFTTGEFVNPTERAKIEQAFSIRERDIYGMVEMGDVGWECSESNGYHLNIDSVYVEVLDGDRPVGPGESGKVVITNLHSLAMPFIRYEIADIVSAPEESPCPCGCNFPRITMLQGREDDWLFGADGRRISPMDITVAQAHGVRQYRVVQKKQDHVIAEIVRGPDFTDDTLVIVKDHLHEVMGPGVQIDVYTVDQIPWQSGGKLRSICCEIN